MALFKSVDFSATGTLQTHTFNTDQNVLIGAIASNTGSDTVEVSVRLRSKYIIKDVVIPVGSTLSLLDGKIVANNGDQLSVQCSTGGTSDIIFSYLESAISAGL